jgi:hypothetical protein
MKALHGDWLYLYHLWYVYLYLWYVSPYPKTGKTGGQR